ncbi:hypothetical protein AX16_007383 [Volvariella volvacea WC 439]|nr:hypothetical protein AX16_007383 [Volvariella volvacea WC 439]
MLLGALFVFLLSRTLAHPVSLLPENPVPPTSPILNAFVAVSDCIRDPSKIRSTSELLWNCLGTVFVCTYVAIHPNMLDRDATMWERLWQKVKTCLYALLAPEVIIVMAMRQRFVASRIARQFRGHGWTMTHGFFMIMGGLMREDEGAYKVVTIDEDGDVEVGGVWKKEGIIFPTISEEEIQDKAKGDFLSKLVVIIQTSWFVVQCIARHAQGLVITELELVTLAFATLNVITYFLWWSKPLNAGYPIYFKKDGSRTSGPMKIAKDNLGVSDRGGYSKENPGRYGAGISDRGTPDMAVQETIFRNVFSLMRDVRGYPGQRFAFLFPTVIERDMWRVSSIIVTVEPALIAGDVFLNWVNDEHPRFETLIVFIGVPIEFLAVFIGPILYIAARVVLLVLSLFSLRDLPPSAHQNVQWSDYIPHI